MIVSKFIAIILSLFLYSGNQKFVKVNGTGTSVKAKINNSKIIEHDTVWSTLITDTFIARHPNHVSYNPYKPKWDYEQGLMLHAIWKVYKKTNNEKYYNYIKNDIDYYINKDGSIKTYSFKKFRLDDITPGRVLLDLYNKTHEAKYKKAAELLRKQINEQPRTPEGGFWHKKIYIEQMWLDGLYMAEPFYAQYAKTFKEKSDFNDIVKQFVLMEKHGKDLKTGLYYHGWDYAHNQKWANPKTGDSQTFWGRAIGWYMMGLIDVLDYLPKNNVHRKELILILRDISKTLLKYQDKKTHLWYQVIDKAGQKGNYLEATCSAMFMYVYAKGANRRYLDKSYFKEAKKVFKGLKENLIVKGKDGMPDLTQCCSGAGLGGHPYRDGSYNYYINVPVRSNDFKGLGPLILGTLELEK